MEVAPAPTPAPHIPPLFITQAWLCMRIHSSTDLSPDCTVYRYKGRVLSDTPHRVRDIPRDVLERTIAAGELYCLWGHASKQGEDLSSLWPYPRLGGPQLPAEDKPVATSEEQPRLL